MTNHRPNFTVSPDGSTVEGPDAVKRAVMSRRHAIARVSKGAIAVGVVAWVTPEILIATPTAAGALSAPPASPGGSGGGGGSGGSGGSGGTPPAVSPSSGTEPTSGTSGLTLSSSGGSATPATAAGSGGGLPFTGLDAVGYAGIGTGLVTAGWELKRWASRHGTPSPAHAGDGGGAAGDSAPE